MATAACFVQTLAQGHPACTSNRAVEASVIHSRGVSSNTSSCLTSTSSCSHKHPFNKSKSSGQVGHLWQRRRQGDASTFEISVARGTRRQKRYSVTGVAPQCAAAGEDGPRQVYRGVYGPWEIEDSDRQEVFFYRAGIVTSSASFITASLSALLPHDSALSQALLPSLDILYAVGASGLGLSLVLVHIYVTPIKRFIQLLWAAGVVGSIGVATNLAWPAGESLVSYSLGHPLALVAVGPVFAALTGLVFKEGLCYGKLEAGALFFIIPTLILGHMSGILDENAQLVLLALWMGLYAIFASRKFSQPVKDDIGDKSVFIFNALPEEKKAELLARMQQGGGGAPFDE